MKITPNKYTNVDLSVLGLSIEIMGVLKETRLEKYGSLSRKVIAKRGERAKNNFVYALVFLYSLNKIEYHPNQDLIGLV